MNKFLFITHMTPRAKRSAFRQDLIDIYYSALKNQTYDFWKVIIIGDEEKTEGKLNYFFLNEGTREEKLESTKKLYARPDFNSLLKEADYIIKLDDDDIISPTLLHLLKDFKDDLYYDEYHSFLDSSSGIITQQKREWLASTCVHKREHILSGWNGPGATAFGNLLYTDHSKAWHEFYKSKSKSAAPKNDPVYLRVLSPTSITSGALNGPPKSIKDVSLEKYYQYLSTFGDWNPAALKKFDPYLIPVSLAWEKFSGSKQKPLPAMKKSLLKKLFGRD